MHVTCQLMNAHPEGTSLGAASPGTTDRLNEGDRRVPLTYRPSWLTLSYITVAPYIRVYDKIDMIGNKASLRDAQRTG